MVGKASSRREKGMWMQDQKERDELARRRQMREQGRKDDNDPTSGDDDQENEMPKFTWSDTFAMIIAAYQVLLPMLLAMIGVMIGAYFLFRLLFH